MAETLRVIAHRDGSLTILAGQERVRLDPVTSQSGGPAAPPRGDAPPAPPKPPISTNPNDETFIGFVLHLETSPMLNTLVGGYMKNPLNGPAPQIQFMSGPVTQPTLDWARKRVAGEFPGLTITVVSNGAERGHAG